MGNRSIAHLVPAFLIAASISASAQYFSTYSTPIQFLGARPPDELSWSSSIRLTETGLLTPPAKPDASWDFWVQSQPIAAGMSWRPPTSTDIKLAVTVPELDDGYLHAFVRYSSDRVHWSSWYDMPEKSSGTASDRQYERHILLPSAAHEKYDELIREWWKTFPDWSSDEHEFCVWLVTHHPDYFANELPFIGYVQVRLEGGASQLRLAGMSVEQSWGVSGQSARPRGTRRASADEKWFFDLKKFSR